MKNSTFAIAALATALMGAPALADNSEARAERFKAMDTDGNGELSQAELRVAAEAHFAEADADGDGALSMEEMTQMHAQRGSRRAARMLENHDANDDGMLDAEELEAMGGHMRGNRRGAKRFDRMDADGDGKLTPEEMMAHRDPARMFATLDRDDSGGISAEEFGRMRRHGKHRMHD